jgi:uncharacterized phiE125 gp8 family phage protein
MSQYEVSQEPLTLDEIRTHLRLDILDTDNQTLEDVSLMEIAAAARESAEIYTGLTVAYRRKTLSLSEFPEKEINLNTWPINGIVSVSYIDENGATQTLASNKYILDAVSKPGKVFATEPWPKTKRDTPNTVTITFDAGFTDGLSPNPYPVPKTIKRAILLLIGHYYANREEVTYANTQELTQGALHLLTQNRINLGM